MDWKCLVNISGFFGLGKTAGIDAILWNGPEYWKFAWEGRCSEFWCFGETAWGDQYAYSLQSKNKEMNEIFFWMHFQ